MDIELRQVKVRLTSDKRILNQLKLNGAFKENRNTPGLGAEFRIQFDSKSFGFKPGVIMQVGETVGMNLIESSRVILGDHLSGEPLPALELVGPAFALGEVTEEIRRSETSCPVCAKEMKTLTSLIRHLERQHTVDRPDLNQAAQSAIEKTDWEDDVLDGEALDKVVKEL